MCLSNGVARKWFANLLNMTLLCGTIAINPVQAQIHADHQQQTRSS